MSAAVSELDAPPLADPTAQRRRLPIARLSKSMAVSLVTTALSTTILAVLTYTHVTSAAHANVIATLAGIGPSYALNRRWVWKRTSRRALAREVAPFWAMCLFALAASTWAVAHAEAWATAHTSGSLLRTAVVLAANLATFGGLWVAQFLLLDRVLFSHSEPS